MIVDQHSTLSLHNRLSNLGLNYLEATKLRTASDTRIEDALAYQKINIKEQEEFIKAPELYVFENCKRTIYEFEHLRWDEWTGKTADRKDQKEKAMDKDDHSIENIGRILVQEPVFVPIQNQNIIVDDPNYDPY